MGMYTMTSPRCDPEARREGEARIDALVGARLSQQGISPAPSCSDEVFVRRVFLDVIGTLPTAREARAFLADKRPDKRTTLIDRLLWRDEFADYWAMKWCDLLRVKSEFPIDLWPMAAQAYHGWIRTSVRQNMPYDRFVRTLLTASGSNFTNPPVNFFRAVQSKKPETISRAVALTFMGSRAEKWPKSRLTGMSGFFSQVGYKYTGEWKEEIVFFDASKPAGGRAFPDGKPVRVVPDRDPRDAFADWLITPSNPWFTLNIVNRIWYWLLGRGIVHEPDDIRADNPAQNPALLTWLQSELVKSNYNLRHIYKIILNSAAYQRASSSAGAKNADTNFARYSLRRLDAEVLIDALNQVTGTTESYSSPIPEPFTFIPESQRSISLPDGSISSSFLEMFGRPPRDSGLESERNNRPTADQRLHLLNSSHIQRKIERGPNISALVRPGTLQQEIGDELYLSILSRFPTEAERTVLGLYFQHAATRRDAVIDIAWALINSAEFMYKH